MRRPSGRFVVRLVAYCGGMAFVTGPARLIGRQLRNAWFYAAVAGVGLTLFQEIIPR